MKDQKRIDRAERRNADELLTPSVLLLIAFEKVHSTEPTIGMATLSKVRF